MKNYKGFYIITSLSEEELNLFENFLKSPYFNTRKKPLELFRIIRKIKRKPESEISKEKIFEKLYPGKKFNTNTFNDLMAQLHKLAEDFLYAEINKKDKIKKSVSLLEKFLEGRLKELFIPKKKQLDKMMDNEPVDSYFFWHSYLKDAYHLNFLQTYKDQKTKRDLSAIIDLLHKTTASILNLTLEEIMELFSQSETRRLKYYDEKYWHTIKTITQTLFDTKFLELVKPNNKYYYNSELLKYVINMRLTRDNSEFYFKYKKAIKKYSKLLTKDQLTAHHALLINYSFHKIIRNPDDLTFTREVNYLFKEFLDKKYYSYTKANFFRPKLYTLFVDSFFMQKDSASIKKMINVCIPLLEKRYMDFNKNLSLSYLYYLSGEFEKALEQIKDIKFHHKGVEFRVKIYQIKLHLLLENTEQALSLADAFIKYIKFGEGENELKYRARLNFGKFVKKIVLTNERGKFDDLKYLQKKIKDEPEINEKAWLLEITDKFLKGNK